MPESAIVAPITAVKPMHTVRKRIVLHFPGFEPLDARAHHARYMRSARQSAGAWDVRFEVGDLDEAQTVPVFDVEGHGRDWQALSRVFIFDHSDIVRKFSRKPLLHRLVAGYASAASVVFQGGLTGYFRHAWRFGLFFIFPFVLVGLALFAAFLIAAAPLWLALGLVHCLWSVPVAFLLFSKVFVPLSDRMHVMHLFADWKCAVAMANMDDPDVARWLDRCVTGVRKALQQEGDEYVVSSHSMGSNAAAHVIGTLLEQEPEIFDGKRIVFVTLGGALLQCALLKNATVLRSRIGLIARAGTFFWLEVQCLTDSIHFYKTEVVKVAGHAKAPQARIAFIRIKKMLSDEHYRKIRRDFLRVHRQYVLGCDRRSSFDFTLMTAGPIAASAYADFSHKNKPVV